jgi:hypothetical protein
VKWCKVFEDKGLGVYFQLAYEIKSLFSWGWDCKVFRREDLILPVKAGLSVVELVVFEL